MIFNLKQMTECPVCIESFNRSDRQVITCSYCHYEACRKCYETYYLQLTSSPRCMGCQKEIPRFELMRQMTKKFMLTSYKEHREKYLLDRERSMLPATQIVVEQMKERDVKLRKIAEIRNLISDLRSEIARIENELYYKNEKAERRQFVRKCPNPTCRGFLSSQWKCNLCERKTCKECNEMLPNGDDFDEHKCDPQTLETVKIINQDSRPCPTCGELIFKIDGCDQIFCTLCHTAFSWVSGKIETGTIHNPHYFEWMRQNNRNVETVGVQVRCGREIDHQYINRSRFPRKVQEFCRRLIHFRLVELPRFQTDRFADNQDLRIQFLKNEITEVTFQKILQKREKSTEKKQEYYRLFAMMIECITEIIYRFADVHAERLEKREYPSLHLEPDIYLHFEPYHKEVLNLLEYVNKCMKDISYTYNSRRYEIDDRLTLASL